MINELRTILTAQTNAEIILANSKMPKETRDEFIKVTSKLLTMSLNITSGAFSLSEDEEMAILTLIIIKVLEITDDNT